MDRFLKIKALKRVPLNFNIKLSRYFIKRKLGFTISEEDLFYETVLQYFLVLLEKYNGKIESETDATYTVSFHHPEHREQKILLRKFPSSDISVFEQIFGKLEYKPVVTLILNKTNLKENNSLNIIDAGGNIGLTSLYFAAYFPLSNFIVIEPSDSNFSVLSANIEKNITGKIHLVKGGLWHNDANLEVKKDFRGGGDWAIRVAETDEVNPDGIKGITIPTLMKKYDFEYIDILKIDIEGSEKNIFAKENNNLDFLNKTRCIAIEIHDEFDCRTDIYSCLDSYGFDYFESGELTIGINSHFTDKFSI